MSLKNNIDKLKFVASVKNPLLRTKLLSELSDDNLFKALNEIAINYFKGNINLNSKQKRQIKKYNRLLKRLTNKNSNKSIKKRLIKQSGGFLPILLPTLASIVTALIK